MPCNTNTDIFSTVYVTVMLDCLLECLDCSNCFIQDLPGRLNLTVRQQQETHNTGPPDEKTQFHPFRLASNLFFNHLLTFFNRSEMAAVVRDRDAHREHRALGQLRRIPTGLGLTELDHRTERSKRDSSRIPDLRDESVLKSPVPSRPCTCVCVTPQEQEVHLLLHFDINKTILMEDPAAGKTVEDTINDILCAHTWGIVPAIRNGETHRTWRAVSEYPTLTPPECFLAEGDVLVTFKTYVDHYECAYTPQKEGESKEEMVERHKIVRERRRVLVSSFTLPGQPGEKYRKFGLRFLKKLTFKDGSGHHYYIIPAFFELILHLIETRRHFSILFRTFGTDVQEIIEDLARFCDGLHPAFKHVDSKSLQNLKVEGTGRFGAFYRDGPGSEGLHLALGTVEQPPISEGLGGYDKLGEGINVVHGFRACHGAIKKLLEGPQRVLGLRDHYDWWGLNEGRSDSGKILLVGPKEINGLECHDIFFDDNATITPHPRNIVDVRDIETGKPIGAEEFARRNVVRVSPMAAVFDRFYFINLLHEVCENVRPRPQLVEEAVVEWVGGGNVTWTVGSESALSLSRFAA